MKKKIKNIIAVFIGIFIALVLVEIILHIYNPFHLRIKSNQIVLPASVTYKIDKIEISGLDSFLIHKKNTLGFRGPELPENKNTFKIFCVGGSTTECFYLNDGKDWPSVLGNKLKKVNPKAWVNNAGLDGHSTRGHLILLRDHLLNFNPNMVVFLTGCNDIAANEINKFEKYHLSDNQRFLSHFELFNLYNHWKMAKAAAQMGVGHAAVNWVKVAKKDTSKWQIFLSPEKDSIASQVKSYVERIAALGRMCQANNCIPVFVGQPTVFANDVDPITGRYLGDIDFLGSSSLHYREKLKLYNNAVAELCKQEHWIYIDAMRQMPASSEYFYDFHHFTIAGSNKMAEIVFQSLIENYRFP